MNIGDLHALVDLVAVVDNAAQHAVERRLDLDDAAARMDVGDRLALFDEKRDAAQRLDAPRGGREDDVLARLVHIDLRARILLTAQGVALVDDAPHIVPAHRLDDRVHITPRAESGPQRDRVLRHRTRRAEVPVREDGIDEYLWAEIGYRCRRGIDHHDDLLLFQELLRLLFALRERTGHALHRLRPVVDRIGKRDLAPRRRGERPLEHEHAKPRRMQRERDARRHLAAAAYHNQSLHFTASIHQPASTSHSRSIIQ